MRGRRQRLQLQLIGRYKGVQFDSITEFISSLFLISSRIAPWGFILILITCLINLNHGYATTDAPIHTHVTYLSADAAVFIPFDHI